MINIIQIREQIPHDVFSSTELKSVLDDYPNVLDKIHRLVRSGELVGIRRGLYTFPHAMRKSPLDNCVVAGVLYGPSYVSLEYALSYHGLIPERVHEITSVTRKRSRRFSTAIGNFSYVQTRSPNYPLGQLLIQSGDTFFTIATPEKAVYDKVVSDNLCEGSDVGAYLFDNLRLDPGALKGFHKPLLRQLKRHSKGFQTKVLRYLEEL